jgi:hypothetical protein
MAEPRQRSPDAGKKPIAITAGELERLARLLCTEDEAASFFDCNVRTIKRYLNRAEFREAWDKGRSYGRLSLRRLQWRHASGTGNSAVQMTIHLSKHWLGESEKVLAELSGKDGGPIRHAREVIPKDLSGLSDDELSALYREAVTASRTD